MAKRITFDYADKKYTLEYTRDTVSRMEQRGFVFDEIFDKPTVRIPQLFAGAFLANHKYLSNEFIEGLYDEFPDKDELLKALIEMYNEPIAELLGSTEDANK